MPFTPISTPTHFYSSLLLTLSKSLKNILLIFLHLLTPCPLPRNPPFPPFLTSQVKTIDFGLMISSPGFNSMVSGALFQARRRNQLQNLRSETLRAKPSEE
jgi:hypothetical protein